MRAALARVRHALRATSIRTRLVAFALVLVGGTTLTVGTLSYRRARTELVAVSDARLQLLSRDTAHTLHRELSGHVADITSWARLETMIALTYGDVDKELAALLGETMRASDDRVAVAGIDRTGEAVATAGDVPVAAAESIADRNTRLSVRVDPQGRALLRLETPVFNPRRPAERIGLLVVLLDPGVLLRRVAAGRLEAGGATLALEAPAGTLAQVGSREAGDRVAGAPMLEARSPVPAASGVLGPALTVVARQPLATALASVHELRATLIRMGVLVVLASGIAGGLVAWRVSRPIRALTAAVEAIAAHGPPRPIAALRLGGGEVGVLADAFDSMLQRLAGAQHELVAQSRLALLGEIAASIAHDVRTPLSVLKTAAQLLASPQLSTSEQRDLAEMIAMEVDRLDRVVTDLVNVTRPQSGTRTPRTVRALIERAAAVLRPWAHARGVALEMAGAGAAGVVVDADQMQQALLNLLHNAVQACAKGGRVRVAWQADEMWVTVEIADSGPGFADGALERAFSPFWTTRPDGTGLGLPIARRIVEAHGGTIGARNLETGGACVWFRLPRG